MWFIIGVLVVLWLLGIIFHIAVWLAWILLIVAAVVLVWDLITGRRHQV